MTTEDGQQLGIMSIREAQDRANEMGLDLVEVAPHANPPVVKIMDYGKHKFEESKAKKEQQKKNKQIEMKEVRLRPVTGAHDLDVKLNSIKKFLEEGRTVQVTVVFARRELQFKDQGLQIIQKVIQGVESVGSPERSPSFNEKRLSVRLLPAKKGA